MKALITITAKDSVLLSRVYDFRDKLQKKYPEANVIIAPEGVDVKVQLGSLKQTKVELKGDKNDSRTSEE